MASYGPLVDTSVLIDYFAAVDNRESDILDSLLANGPPPATALIIVQEYLQGLSTVDEFVLARADLENFELLSPPDYPIHIRAAEWHVRIKRRGTTIPTMDTLIVTIAKTAACPLLTRDNRQKDLASFMRVKLA